MSDSHVGRAYNLSEAPASVSREKSYILSNKSIITKREDKLPYPEVANNPRAKTDVIRE